MFAGRQIHIIRVALLTSQLLYRRARQGYHRLAVTSPVLDRDLESERFLNVLKSRSISISPAAAFHPNGLTAPGSIPNSKGSFLGLVASDLRLKNHAISNPDSEILRRPDYVGGPWNWHIGEKGTFQ